MFAFVSADFSDLLDLAAEAGQLLVPTPQGCCCAGQALESRFLRSCLQSLALDRVQLGPTCLRAFWSSKLRNYLPWNVLGALSVSWDLKCLLNWYKYWELTGLGPAKRDLLRSFHLEEEFSSTGNPSHCLWSHIPIGARPDSTNFAFQSRHIFRSRSCRIAKDTPVLQACPPLV